MLRRLLGPALLLTVAAFSGGARAEDAQALFDEGLTDMRAGRFRIGCALIKQSLDIDARPGTVFTLAECYSKAGRFASAVALYDRYLTVYEGMQADQRQQQEARAEVSRSERTRLVALVAWLRVSLPEAAPPGFVATMDGEPFSPALFGVATAVDPGAHVFTTRAPDGPLIEQRIDIAPGERRSLILALRTASAGAGEVPDDVTPPDPEPDPTTAKRGLTPWFWVAGGVGVAGLVTGAVSGVLLLDARSAVQKGCHPSEKNSIGQIPCDPSGYDGVAVGQGPLATVAPIGFAVGAAGILTAVVLYVTDGSRSRTTHGAVPTFAVGPGLATIGVQSAF